MNERLKQLHVLLEESPTDGFLLFAVAKEYEGLGNLEKAVELYEELRQIDKEYIGLYYHLAHNYVELELPDKALHIYKTGIEIAERLHDLHALSELKNAKLNLELEL